MEKEEQTVDLFANVKINAIVEQKPSDKQSDKVTEDEKSDQK